MRGLPKFDDPNLIVGAESFSDAGVYRLREDLYLVQSLDFFPPLVNDPFTFGRIAAANALSDLYAMGAQPMTALNIVGFPDDELELEVLTQILAGGAEQVRKAGAVVSGGHTVRDHEIKYGLSVSGVVAPDRMTTNTGAQPGDVVVLTKPLGTGFITTAAKAGKCSEQALAAAIDSMVELNSAGAAAAAGVARAVTDVTGFGLAGHVGEMARASGVSVSLQVDQFPELPEALDMYRLGQRTRASRSNREFLDPDIEVDQGVDVDRLALAFDPQTSGGLLISVPADQASAVVAAAHDHGAPAATIVGQVLSRRSPLIRFS